jgi:hypothetical protein
MKIFVVHSSSYDFQGELYQPLRNSKLNKKDEISFPQEKGYETITKETIKNSDLIIAEVSYPSTGEGIELGWADIFGIPIICIYQKEKGLASKSLEKITRNFIAYQNSEDMIRKLEQFISGLKI